MQRVVDVLYPEFKRKEEEVKRELYYRRMKDLGRDVEKIKKEKEERRKRNASYVNKNIVEKQIMFYLIPAVNLKRGEYPMKKFGNQTFKTNEKRDIRYLKKFLAFKLDYKMEEIDIYWYNQKLCDSRELYYVYQMHWLNHEITKMKPEEEAQWMILHYCKKELIKISEKDNAKKSRN